MFKDLIETIERAEKDAALAESKYRDPAFRLQLQTMPEAALGAFALPARQATRRDGAFALPARQATLREIPASWRLRVATRRPLRAA